ncbi:MAG: hypothetical protein QW063_02325 [Candidatus Nanoarchaeia archaeon]
MKKTLLVIILALASLVSLAPIYGLEFSSDAISLCATDTAVFVTSVTNTADYQDSFTVSLGGDAAKWAIAAPAGFSLNPGETENIYLYVTPSINSLAGTYTLDVTVTGHSKTETGSVTLKVLDCHSAEFSVVGADSAEVCAVTKATYILQLNNTGKYTENFVLSLSGLPAKFSTLSQQLVTLAAGQSATIEVYSTPPADQTGDFTMTVTAASQNSRATATQQLKLKSKQCYDFIATTDVNYLSFCEASEAKIPITLENKGSVDNTFTLNVEGPSWATVENTKVDVPAGQARFTNLILYPGYKVSGDFNIKLIVEPAKGFKTTIDFVANVKSCNSVDLKLSTTKDKICPNTEKAYALSIVNTGEFGTRYGISVSGADFVSVDKSFIDLNPSEKTDFNLVLKPTATEPAGKRTIIVKAEAQDNSKASATATLDLDVAPMTDCYGVKVTAALTRVEVAAGEPALVPIIIENKGLENSTYNLDVSGTGAAFVQLNPASLVLSGKEAKTVYAYVAVPEGTASDAYKVTVAARLEDQASTVSTASFDIILGKPTKIEEGELIKEQTTTQRLAAIKATIKAFFSQMAERMKALFANVKVPKVKPLGTPETAEEAPLVETNITVTNETNITVSEENLTVSEKANITTTEVGTTEGEEELPENASTLLSEGVKAKLGIGAEEKETEGRTFKEKLLAVDFSNLSLSTGFASIVTFLTTTTYWVPNWLFIVAVILIVTGLSYLLRSKDLIEKFNKFLEEEPKQLQEKKENEKNNESKDKKLSAQELLDQTGEKKKKGKKR